MYRHQSFERAFRTGAAITAAGAAFLGGITLRSAEAGPIANMANAPEHIDKKPVPQKGLPADMDVLRDITEINVESQVAFSQLDRRWNAPIYVHAPTKIKNAIVNFAKSPSAVEKVSTGMGFNGQGREDAIEVLGGGIEKFKGKTYLVILDETTSRPGYLNLDWAIKAGAVDFKEIVGEKPRSLAYSPLEDTPPTVRFVGRYLENKNFRYTQGIDGKLHKVRPSSVVPKP